MKKIFCLSITICILLSVLTTTCYAAEGTIASPATGDVASVVALTLAGVAAIGGFLLKRAK